jgi:hypothetical protein
MHAGPHVLSRLAALLVLAGLVVPGCGDGGPERRPAATPTAAAGTATPSATRPATGGTPWPHEKVLRRIAGRRIRVEGRMVRVDPATVTCGGLGTPAGSVGGEDAWTHFRCVQPTFPAGAVAGPDAIFFVEPRGPRRFEVTESHFTRY